MSVLFLFGDSITYGAWDGQLSGWANQLRAYADQRVFTDPDFYSLVYCLGIPGETTSGLVNRFKHETEARLRIGQENIFVFAYGANDAKFPKDQQIFTTAPELFEKNLDQAITEAKKYSKNIFLLGITPVIEEQVNARGKSLFYNKNVDQYNTIIKALADKQAVEFIDLSDKFGVADPKSLFDEDGLHPNDKGHAIIFEAVKNKLEKLL